MKMSLDNKVVVYTGAAGLIGSAASRALYASGARLALIDRNEEGLKLLCKDLCSSYDHKDILLISDCDLLSASAIDAALTTVIERFGKIDCLVNCHYPRTKDWGNLFESIDLESLRMNVDTHLNSYFLLCQRAALKMIDQGYGNIVNFSSIYGVTGPDFSIYDGTKMTMPAGYAVIKGGITNFTRYLASYLGPRGIRVNALCPGGVFDGQAEEFVEKYRQKVPLRRMAKIEDVVGPLLFLISDQSAYINGVNLPVDGGWLAI